MRPWNVAEAPRQRELRSPVYAFGSQFIEQQRDEPVPCERGAETGHHDAHSFEHLRLCSLERFLNNVLKFLARRSRPNDVAS
jgi:hypothetical protein